MKEFLIGVLAGSVIGMLTWSQPLVAAEHPAKCLTVDVHRFDSHHYEQVSVNHCNQELPVAVVMVKFFNTEWERIGVSAFVAYHVAPHEKLRKIMETPGDLRDFQFVGIRAISDDPLDALR
jgi:hypothetical protein